MRGLALFSGFVVMVLWSVASPTSASAQVSFPHEKHSALVFDCASCHSGIPAGVTDERFPDSSTCSPCHDGSLAPDIEWQRPDPRVSSLSFDHQAHAFDCGTCHLPGGADQLEALAIPEPESCFGCHDPGTEHRQASDCGFCHARVVDFRLTGPGLNPTFHEAGFTEGHAVAASAGQPDCTSCHAENTCTQCHDGVGSPDFHPLNFLASHGPEAFGRVSDCTSCHSTEAFCRECHAGLGFNSPQGLAASFHTSQGFGFFGHSVAARQDLESCVTCHDQNDCMRCHSAQTSLGINPHGPGFNAAALNGLNRASCELCHKGGG